MESYSVVNVNTLSSFETENLPNGFFVDDSAIDREEEHDHGVDSFPMHRKLLRRRHVRKLQKSKERERRQKEEEEQKLKELTRDRDQKRRLEKKRALRDNQKASYVKSSAKRIVYFTESNESGNLITSPVPALGGKSPRGTKNNNINAMPLCISSPTSVFGLHGMVASTPTKSPTTTTIELFSKVSSSSAHGMALNDGSTAYLEINFRCCPSFSLPEFSPVRPTKFRKLQL